MCAPTTSLQSRVYDHRSPACFPFPSSVCTYVIEYVSSRLSRSFTANSTIRFHATLPTLSNSPTCFDPLDGNPDRIRVICWDILVASGGRGVTSRSAALPLQLHSASSARRRRFLLDWISEKLLLSVRVTLITMSGEIAEERMIR